MTPKLPHSPLTTRLSGSARETEHRIRNIFEWKKKRPPVAVLALSALVIALCGSLVSCQVGTAFVSNVASGRVDQVALRDDLAQVSQALFPLGSIQPTSVELIALTPGDGCPLWSLLCAARWYPVRWGPPLSPMWPPAG